jgi:hypothetical protein
MMEICKKEYPPMVLLDGGGEAACWRLEKEKG